MIAMNWNAQLLAALIMTILTTGCTTAFAGHKLKHQQREHFTDTARVTRVVPLYRTVQIAEPRKECYEKEVRRYYHDANGYNSATPMIAGGVLGGIIGNQFGKGNGKTAMTIAGTVLGGSIGRDVGMRNKRYSYYEPKTETHCEVINDYREEEELDGYRVSYRYHGEEFNTILPYHPGKRLKLDVSIKPYE
jgi:uncharacterized protein YcfJ